MNIYMKKIQKLKGSLCTVVVPVILLLLIYPGTKFKEHYCHDFPISKRNINYFYTRSDINSLSQAGINFSIDLMQWWIQQSFFGGVLTNGETSAEGARFLGWSGGKWHFQL
jgi:hypothetical protein